VLPLLILVIAFLILINQSSIQNQARPLQQLLLLSFTPPFPSSVKKQSYVQESSKYNGLEENKTDCAHVISINL